MKAVLQVSMQIACGSWDLEDVDSLSLDRFQAPSPATLTRGRYKLDIFHMLLRQDHWKRTQFENSFVSLCNLLALGGVILLAFLVGLALLKFRASGLAWDRSGRAGFGSKGQCSNKPWPCLSVSFIVSVAAVPSFPEFGLLNPR